VLDAAQSELERLERVWAERGVEIDAHISKDSWGRHNLHLSRIIVARPLREQGIGTRAMNELVALADRHGLLMTLSPAVDFGGSSAERLKKFYRRFGFVSNKGRYKDFTLSDAMYRLPARASLSGPRMGAVEGWVVTHDGETLKAGFKNDSEAVSWLHKRHSYSVDHAVKYEGYDIVLVENGKVAYSYKRDSGRKLGRAVMGDLKTKSQHPIPVWPEFVDAYLAAALWASAPKDEEQLDAKYTLEDFAQEAVDQAVQDANDFIRDNRMILRQASSNKAQHGHDFFLTRNLHGAGFRDRGYGAIGERLANAARAFGPINAYADGDGKVRFE